MSETKELTKYRLPAEFAAKWITALRSGEYKQTTGKLVVNLDYEDDPQPIYGYCCLGVAAAICGVTVETMGINGMLDSYLFKEKGVEKPESLPLELLTDYAKAINGGTLPRKLAELNDTDGYTFDQIADYIEKEVELYE